MSVPKMTVRFLREFAELHEELREIWNAGAPCINRYAPVWRLDLSFDEIAPGLWSETSAILTRQATQELARSMLRPTRLCVPLN